MKLVGAAAPLEVDGSARVLLPASQRAAAGIERRAVLLGMGTRLELWSEQAHLAKVRETILEDQVTPEMAGLRL
jgi:MraZ protein